jgi:hypothetical protein
MNEQSPIDTDEVDAPYVSPVIRFAQTTNVIAREKAIGLDIIRTANRVAKSIYCLWIEGRIDAAEAIRLLDAESDRIPWRPEVGF